jgi:hypothetical protein
LGADCGLAGVGFFAADEGLATTGFTGVSNSFDLRVYSAKIRRENRLDFDFFMIIITDPNKI